MTIRFTRRKFVVNAVAGISLAAAPPAVAAPMWRDEKRFADVFGKKMAYYEKGSGRPIVFLHGNPTSSYLWRKIIPYVQGQGRCIAPDLMGMGDSDKLARDEYTFPSHRRYLYELFRVLGVERDVVLVLHDWGSALGFHFASRSPESIRGIAYMEPILLPPQFDRAQLKPDPMRAKLLSPQGERLILQDNFRIEMFLHNNAAFLTDADKAEYRRPFLEPGESRRPLLEFTRQGPFGSQESFDAIRSYSSWLVRSERTPKLFFRVEPGNLLPKGSPALKLALSCPNQKVVTVRGRHFVQEHAPDAVGKALSAWLKGLA